MSSVSPQVIMARNAEKQWQVEAPGGLLDVSASKTSGLQEAIDYAAENSLNLHVIGGAYGVQDFDQISIKCTTTVNFPPMQNAHWNIEGVVLDFPEALDGDGVRFDSLLHSFIKINSVINYRGNAAAVHVNPTSNYLPRGAVPIFGDSALWISRVRVRSGNDAVGLKLSGANIARNRFDMIEIEGDVRDGVPVMSRGIHVAGNHPSNWFTVQALLAPGICGIEVEGAVANRFEAHIEPCGAIARGVRTSGSHGHYVLDIADGAAPHGVGIELAEGASDNSFIVQRNSGLVPVVDNAPQGRNRFL